MLFFLIISTMVTPATIRVMLPKSTTSEEAVVKKNINLTITADYRYYINNVEIGFDEVEAQLSQILAERAENEEAVVLLQVDKSLNIQDLINVIDVGNKLKVKMVLFTQKEKN